MSNSNTSGGGFGRTITNLLLAALLACYWLTNEHAIFGAWYGWDFGTVTFDREDLGRQLDRWETGEDVRSKFGWRLVGPAGDAGGGRVVWVTRRAWREQVSGR